MTILLWLLPAALATVAAMVVVSFVGRERPERERSEAEKERFAAAILKPLPPAVQPRPGADRRRTDVAAPPSSGVAVRRQPSPRRSA